MYCHAEQMLNIYTKGAAHIPIYRHGGVCYQTAYMMKYKHKQTCRVRAAQRPAHINIWCNDHAYTSTSDVISPYCVPPGLPRPESTDPPRRYDHTRQRYGGVCDQSDEIYTQTDMKS